jgi:hypothetical protein
VLREQTISERVERFLVVFSASFIDLCVGLQQIQIHSGHDNQQFRYGTELIPEVECLID